MCIMHQKKKKKILHTCTQVVCLVAKTSHVSSFLFFLFFVFVVFFCFVWFGLVLVLFCITIYAIAKVHELAKC